MEQSAILSFCKSKTRPRNRERKKDQVIFQSERYIYISEIRLEEIKMFPNYSFDDRFETFGIKAMGRLLDCLKEF